MIIDESSFAKRKWLPTAADTTEEPLDEGNLSTNVAVQFFTIMIEDYLPDKMSLFDFEDVIVILSLIPLIKLPETLRLHMP